MTLSSNADYETFTPNVGRTQLTSVFPNRAEARHVINDLRAFGLRLDQISVAMRDRHQQDKLIGDTGAHAAAGAAGGAEAERPQGGLRGFMDGLRAGNVPRIPALASAATLTQVPAMPGGVIGALIGIQIPEAEARQREAGYRLGCVLVSANVFEGVAEAQGIMQRYGGGMVNQAKQPILA